MKRISLSKASRIYDELKFHKNDFNQSFVGIYLHNNDVKIGYSNRFGKSDFIHNNEKRILVIDDELITDLLNDYYKKDAVKIIHDRVNDEINYQNERKNSITWKI